MRQRLCDDLLQKRREDEDGKGQSVDSEIVAAFHFGLERTETILYVLVFPEEGATRSRRPPANR